MGSSLIGLRIAVMAACMVGAVPAAAQEVGIDLSKPDRVAAAVRDAGFKAELLTNKAGEPYISSAANGSPFTIEFYGCKGTTDCGSLQFFGWYKKDPLYTPALVNEWNASKRFLKIAIDKDGDLSIYMDVTSVGRVSKENFADWIDWYQTMDAELDKFLTAKRAPAAGQGAATAGQKK